MSSVYDGTAGFHGNNISGLKLDTVVIWKGTALPVGAANKVPQNGFFMLVDSLSTPTTKTWYVQTSATLSSPSFVEIAPEVIAYVLDDDFSSDNWTDSGATTKVNTGTGVLDWDSTNDGNGCRITLSESLSSVFMARLKCVIDTKSGTGNRQFVFVFTDSNAIDEDTTTRDFIGFKFILSTSTINAIYGDGVTIDAATVSALSRTLTAETLYIEIRRVLTELRIKLFSDSAFSTLLETHIVTIPALAELDNILAIEDDISGTGSLDGTIDDLQVRNDILSW